MRFVSFLLILEKYLAELLLLSLPLFVFEMHLATSAGRVVILVLPSCRLNLTCRRWLQDWLVFAIRGGCMVVKGLHTRRFLLLLPIVVDVLKRMRQLSLLLGGRG